MQMIFLATNAERQCAFCGNIFRKSSDLEIHTRIVHEEYLQEKLNLILWSQGEVSTKAKLKPFFISDLET